MKANVHLEFGDREIEDFASRAAAKWFVNVMRSVGDDLNDVLPRVIQAFQDGKISFDTKPTGGGPAPTDGPQGPSSDPASQPNAPYPPTPSPDAPDAVIAAWYRQCIAARPAPPSDDAFCPSSAAP